MHLIVGLGNPGSEYEKTRHNVGFTAIDYLASELGVNMSRLKFKGICGEGFIGTEKCIFLKPQTFMNLSGQSVREAAEFYKISPENIIVVYDDVTLDVGKVRIRPSGSAGGHNGMKNVVQHLGTKAFKRVRVGIGRDMQIKIIDYVLMRIPKADEAKMEEAFTMAKDAVLLTLDKGFNHAMNKYN